MTTGWFIFGVVMPAIGAGGGWITVLLYDRSLQEQVARRAKPA